MDTHAFRQERLLLNQNSTAISFSITILKYIFVKGNAGIIFTYKPLK